MKKLSAGAQRLAASAARYGTPEEIQGQGRPDVALVRVAAGVYTVGHYTVEKHQSGWLFRDQNDISISGEWRTTRREAHLDLIDYLTRTQ